MSVAQLKTFLKNIDTKKYKSQKSKIYRYIKNNPNCTIEDIVFFSTGMKKETIVGRVSELCDMGVVKYNGFFESKASSYSKLLVVEDKTEQLELITERENGKKIKALKVLLGRFKDALSHKTIEQLKTEF